ncbi:uncharacterized protein FOBCDRAFT_39400 [Fusarium oxysporum Fo47]|uniref:uncharacterized protein n=1 Tax=Fusarium oxysporum Fo47 TaxID=660027 RepID=UPI0028699D12|nr:uncharacterized protein FOBCDRAFT_39400 [Fusarium oxysporum Fo47]QKD55510.2 hypothetical protein FOBCDRAFT_39400 [Fusarium oxysporum Fo47]
MPNSGLTLLLRRLVSPCRGSRMTDLHNSRQPDMTSPPHRFRTTIMACNSYPVYKVKSHMALPDPHMPPGRFHHAIFVETSDNGFGTLYHVTGDVTSANGMSYESRDSPDPAQLEGFYSKELLGYTGSDVHPQQWSSVLASLPTPPQQKASSPKNQGRVEPFKEKVGGYGYVFILMEKSVSLFGNALSGLSGTLFLLFTNAALFKAVVSNYSNIASPCSIVQGF